MNLEKQDKTKLENLGVWMEDMGISLEELVSESIEISRFKCNNYAVIFNLSRKQHLINFRWKLYYLLESKKQAMVGKTKFSLKDSSDLNKIISATSRVIVDKGFVIYRSNIAANQLMQDVMNRTVQNSDLSVYELFLNELNQKENYDLLFTKQCDQLDEEQNVAVKEIQMIEKSLETAKKNELIAKHFSSYVSKGIQNISDEISSDIFGKKRERKLRYTSFFTKQEIKKAAKELKIYLFETKLKINANIGYVKINSSKDNLQALKKLKARNGRSLSQKVSDMTIKAIDQTVIDTLESIAKYELDKNVASYARKLVEMYRLTEELNPGKKLKSGKY
ncbi:hypothetical protein HOK51_00075 [Candidatus Woesearchaeota archaeon]|jgi:hypothetical protein|nr:hypothetical protein [archaeon]MBT6518208.1 hypothetical protein [Candidatus Woesearchaeota archaeon]MBT7368523.1 hypothetical protein [Candidatus Woesearchaeota archaeon]